MGLQFNQYFRHIRRIRSTALLAAAALTGLAAPGSWAADSAVIFMYHRFGESRLPATNIRIEQFDAHIQELKSGKYNLAAVPDILAAIQDGRELPDRTVGITIDDAFKSLYEVGWPRFKKAGIPITLFVATDAIDKKLPDYMTWDQIREMRDAGVTIGSQTATHLHMAHSGAKANRADLALSNERFKAELGSAPQLFAYPYGEASIAVKKYVSEAGFSMAFGQHSGVIYRGIDKLYMPRFALNENYGDMDRFRLAANALPLKVRDVIPADTILREKNNPPRFGFTVYGGALRYLDKLNCYASGQDKTRLVRLGKQRIETRMKEAFPPGRARINCTMPAGEGRWRWFGTQFVVFKS